MLAHRQSILLYNFLIAQIIVSCRGNIGNCAIYCAIVTIDVKSYCTNSQSSPLITVKPKCTESNINTFGILFKFILVFKFILPFVIDCVIFLHYVFSIVRVR